MKEYSGKISAINYQSVKNNAGDKKMFSVTVEFSVQGETLLVGNTASVHIN